VIPAGLAALLLIGRIAAGQEQPKVVVRDPGPGPVGRYLDELLRKPDTRVIVGDTVTIGKDADYPAAVVVIGRRANVAGHMRGDVVVVGGDLFLKPGGQIEGQGVAIGGGAHNSALGYARGGLASNRDFTFDAEPVAGVIELRYRENYVHAKPSVFSLPALYGLRIPSYDRSNGLSIPVGPAIDVGRASTDLVATYRSQLGRVDPSVDARLQVGRKLWLEASAGRDTRSNEDWINGRLSNSLNSVLSGHDERNWYRATGGKATVNRLFETATMSATYSLGGSFERASAMRPGPAVTGGPWSLTERRDAEDGMFRVNPQIPGGDITIILGGADLRWVAGNVKAHLGVDVELPVSVSTGESFNQAVVDGRIEFPTFGSQRYRMELHGVLTNGDVAPAQRFAYLGGGGTLPTETFLGRGGDEVLFIDSRYEIPLPVALPIAGVPSITFRHILGGAGVQSLPDLTQIVGARLSVPFVRVQWLINTATRKTKFTAGLSLSR
jgi:hypothetical protein